MDKTALLKKVRALAEHGVGGEAENAEKLLARMMKKYGINVERGQGQERGRFRRALAGVRAEFPYSRRGVGANVRSRKNRRYQRVEQLRRLHE